MSTNKLSATSFTELYELLMDKHLIEQNFQTISGVIQAKFDPAVELVNGT